MESNHTSDLTSLPLGEKAKGCKWVCKLKLYPDGTVGIYKECIVAKGYNQDTKGLLGVDLKDTKGWLEGCYTWGSHI